MAQTTSSPNSSRRSWGTALSEPDSLISALKWGAIIGVAYYLVAIAMTGIQVAIENGNAAASQSPAFAIPAFVALFALFFALYSAGSVVGRERLHVAPGVLCAVIMIALSKGLSLLYSPMLPNASSTANASQPAYIVPIAFLFDLALVVLIGYMGAFYGVKNKLKLLAKTEA